MVQKTRPFGIFLALTFGCGLMLALVWGLSSVPHLYAANITVNTTEDEYNSDGDCSLREAIAAANNDTAVDACGPGTGNDVIQFSLSTPALITLTQGQLSIEKDAVTLTGPGVDLLAISGNQASRIFDIAYNIAVTLTGMTVRDGSTSGDGGGLRSAGPLTLINTTFINNTAGDDGGAIDVQGSLTISSTNILSNTAAGQGGGINGFGTTTSLTGGRFEDNRAGSFAGGVYANGSLVVTGTQFISNAAQTYVGAVWAWKDATITNATFTQNRANNNNIGAMYVREDLLMTASSFISNTAGQKIGAALGGNDVHITGGVFSGNVAAAGRAGALDVSGGLWITGTHFTGNEATGSGAAVVHTGDNGRLINTLFARNNTNGDGSTIYLAQSGDMELVHATIVGPAQPLTSAIAINAGGSVTVVNSIVSGYTFGLDLVSGTAYEDTNLFYQTVPRQRCRCARRAQF
ncbi:MAG: CSLREA domain-containing protein [Anaerolineae bacterium]